MARLLTERRVLVALLVLVALVLLLLGTGALRTEYQKRPQVREKVATRDVSYLYQFYVRAAPNTAGRPYVGNASAPVALIVYVNSDCAACRRFVNDTLPQLETDYVWPGTLRIYYKVALTRGDVENQSDEYARAAALDCIGTRAPQAFELAVRHSQSAAAVDAQTLISAANLTTDDVKKCQADGGQGRLIEDMAETETFGIAGGVPRLYFYLGGAFPQVYTGVPPYTDLQTALRAYERALGRS
jgi:protein-disulfide isomerase